MAQFATRDQEKMALYKLMIGLIVPRPIAWVATLGADGVPNLAPFSFFNGVCPDPPTVAFSVVDREGSMKDTSRNIEHLPEYVIHIVKEDLAEQMNTTCADFGAHVDEFSEVFLDDVNDVFRRFQGRPPRRGTRR